MHPGNSFGQFTVSYSLALEIREGLVVPMTTETVLKHLDEADSVHVTIRSPVNDSFHLISKISFAAKVRTYDHIRAFLMYIWGKWNHFCGELPSWK